MCSLRPRGGGGSERPEIRNEPGEENRGCRVVVCQVETFALYPKLSVGLLQGF